MKYGHTKGDSYMNYKSKLKTVIDIAMIISLFVLMSFQFTAQKNHEISGLVMLILFVLHNFMNYKWYLALGKGTYSLKRSILTITNIIFFIDMVVLIVSGIGISGYVFKFLDLNMSIDLARSLHMVASYVGFLLMGFHIGLHYVMILARLQKVFTIRRKSKVLTWIIRCVVGIVSAYGVYALFKRNFISYITLQMHFVIFDYKEPIIFYVMDLMAITVFMIHVGYYLNTLFIKISLMKEEHKNRKGSLIDEI